MRESRAPLWFDAVGTKVIQKALPVDAQYVVQQVEPLQVVDGLQRSVAFQELWTADRKDLLAQQFSHQLSGPSALAVADFHIRISR